ncbi:TPA: hypothetical protein PBO77_001333 [Escherichia coli]|uniref:DUF6246 family protein n=1 Tax=Escherichia coli TaxID=562 RepID=UPI000DE57524|nr:DUF6246 family protein [Escherichia coli]MCF3347046.1 DUF6246 family protein [Escherichia coli]HAI5500950.1 hypothetical protein [Escherichia coli]HDD8611361.1 hypothetical protein [Escherichia coli]
MIHVRTGQFAAVVNGKRYEFNPCFAAMAKIGNDSELVEYFALIHGSKYPSRLPTDPDLRNRIMARCYGEIVQTSMRILKCCSDDEIAPLLGECRSTSSGKLRLKPGLMPTSDVITLAQHCMYHGLIGDGPEEDAGEIREGEYKPTFNVLEFVYSAVAHLGLSESEAWNMTMTGYRAAVRAKTPPEARNKQKRPNVLLDKKAYDDGMNGAMEILKRMKNREQEKAR